MILKILNLILTVNNVIEETPTQLRGFIGNKFEKYTELHHHLESADGNNKLKYDYPRIQYKIKNNKAIILGIGEQAMATLKNIVMNVNELLLGKNTYKIIEIKARYEESEFGIVNEGEIITYKFLSPWLALNEKNYQKFKGSSIKERRELLKKILIGNILSVSKRLGYDVPNTIRVDIELSSVKVSYKDVPLVGFKGVFEVNFLIPDYLGVGKGVSHGFGVVKKTSNLQVKALRVQ